MELGPRHRQLPANVPKIRHDEVIAFMRRLLSQSPELQAITQRVDHECGRPRALPVDVLLAAAVAVAATDSSKMHVRGIAALLRSLPIPEQRLLGIRWVDPHGGGEKLITERQVEYLFGQISAAFDLSVSQHDHLFISGEDVWNPDGEWVCPLDAVKDSERGTLQCTPTCPQSTSMEALGNRLLAQAWTMTGIPDSDKWAVDSTVVETHFGTRSFGRQADINPDYLPESDRHLAASISARGRRSTKKATKSKSVPKWKKQWSADFGTSFSPQTREPSSRRPSPGGPLAPGEFKRLSPNFPQVAPDGRLLHTKDHGARNAYRGAGNTRPSQVVNGRDNHAFVCSGLFPDGTPMPPLVRAYHAVPGGDAKEPALFALLNHATNTGVTPSTFTADRIYSQAKAENLQHPLTQMGWTLVRDLKDNQRPTQPWAPGVQYLDGWWFTSGLPTGLLELPRPPMTANSKERQEHQERFNKRVAFAFRTNGTTSAGNIRLRGPAVPDQINKDSNGNVLSVRGVRVRCPNSAYFTLVPRTIPATTCKRGQPCGCSLNLTIKANEIPNSCEPQLWGTTRWAEEYGRRNLSESAFSYSQFHLGFDRHSIRVRAAKWDLAFALVQLAQFVQQFHSLVMRLGAHTLDPGYHSALDPEVFIPALKRVLTPRLAQRTGSRGDPPDQ